MSSTDMFYNAKPPIFEKAKALRNNMTKAELLLWERLRNNQVLGLRFRAQHPIDVFIADFYCHPLKLVIEIDGGVHADEEQSVYDEGRTAELNNMDIEVIRFSNVEVVNNIDFVVEKIREYCIRKMI